MAFQPKGPSGGNSSIQSGSAFPTRPSQSSSSSTTSASTLDGLVEQIADKVREKLIAQGVPLPESNSTQAAQPGKYTPSVPAAAFPGAALQALVYHGADRVGHAGEAPFQPHVLNGDMELAGKIDHTLLKPDATKEEIQRVCEEARKHHFATVCVNSTYVGIAADLLKGSRTKAIAVVGFPLGAASTASKAFEAREAIRAGAQEIDMVINIGALKGRDYTLVLEDIRKVVEASQPYPVKVILETSSLNHDEKVIACSLSKAAGAAFVKTSTGFGSGGATADDIALMRRVVGPEMGVKASGGIRTYEDAAKMIAAGATRIGASASVAIVMHASSPAAVEGRPTQNKEVGGSDPSGAKKPFKTSLY